MDTLQTRQNSAETIALSPEIIDAISAIQSAHHAVLRLQDSLQERDPALLEEFGFQDKINARLEDIGGLRSSLLHLLADLADCTW